MTMAWISLIVAGLFEVCGVLSISRLHRDKSLFSLVQLLIFFGLSFFFLSLALEVLPMGTTYAVWTGIGASGGALLGMVLFGESKDWKRIFFIMLIIFAVVGLKLVS